MLEWLKRKVAPGYDNSQEDAEIKLRIVDDKYLKIDFDSLKKSEVVQNQAKLVRIQLSEKSA